MKDASNNKKDRVSSKDTVKFKSFKELEDDEFSDIKPDDFKKAQLNEFKNKELKDFKKILNNWKTDKIIENLRFRLNSDDVTKNTLKELDKIGLDGRLALKLLKMLKNRSY